MALDWCRVIITLVTFLSFIVVRRLNTVVVVTDLDYFINSSGY
jgi:hypothetical protein